MEEIGDAEKQIWFTELGCPGVRDRSLSKGWWIGKSPDEKEQAAWVRVVYNKPLKWKGSKKNFGRILETPMIPSITILIILVS